MCFAKADIFYVSLQVLARASLWDHQKQHVESKPYDCVGCVNGFSHLSYLAKQRRNHTGEKSVNCLVCREGFIFRKCLKRHMKSHVK